MLHLIQGFVLLLWKFQASYRLHLGRAEPVPLEIVPPGNPVQLAVVPPLSGMYHDSSLASCSGAASNSPTWFLWLHVGTICHASVLHNPIPYLTFNFYCSLKVLPRQGLPLIGAMGEAMAVALHVIVDLKLDSFI